MLMRAIITLSLRIFPVMRRLILAHLYWSSCLSVEMNHKHFSLKKCFRCDFYLQVISSVVSFWFFISSVVETYCLGWFASESHLFTEISVLDLSEEHNDGICYGLKYRTISLVGSCMDFLGQLQMLVLMKLGWEPKVTFFNSCY